MSLAHSDSKEVLMKTLTLVILVFIFIAMGRGQRL